MDCLENESVCSVKKENNLGYYRIHSIWHNNGFRINIASRDGAWTGEMKPENVQSVSSELKLEPDKYLAECKEALTTDDGKKGYYYAVENGSFTWKKMIDEDSGIKIRMGSVTVQPVGFVDTIQNIIEVALNCKKNLNKELKSLRQEREGNLQRIHQLQEKLEELCDKKNAMETDLYSKFLLLLNSKKRKIQDLETSSLDTEEKLEKLRHCKNGNKNKAEAVTVAEAYERDTEDEEESREDEESVNEKFIETSVEKSSDDLLKNKTNCTDGETQKGHSACMGSDINGNDETPDLDIACESSTIPGTSNVNISSVGSKAIKNVNNSFPATRADILDFFFGPT